MANIIFKIDPSTKYVPPLDKSLPFLKARFESGNADYKLEQKYIFDIECVLSNFNLSAACRYKVLQYINTVVTTIYETNNIMAAYSVDPRKYFDITDEVIAILPENTRLFIITLLKAAFDYLQIDLCIPNLLHRIPIIWKISVNVPPQKYCQILENSPIYKLTIGSKVSKGIIKPKYFTFKVTPEVYRRISRKTQHNVYYFLYDNLTSFYAQNNTNILLKSHEYIRDIEVDDRVDAFNLIKGVFTSLKITAILYGFYLCDLRDQAIPSLDWVFDPLANSQDFYIHVQESPWLYPSRYNIYGITGYLSLTHSLNCRYVDYSQMIMKPRIIYDRKHNRDNRWYDHRR